MFVSYDPAKHSNLPLFEIKSTEMDGGIIATYYDPVPESEREIANIVPYYYVVDVEDDTT